MPDPWTVLGWLFVAILVVLIVALPFGAALFVAQWRRVRRRQEQFGREVEQDVGSTLREASAPRAGRWGVPPPRAPGSPPPPRPTRWPRGAGRKSDAASP